MSVKIIRQNGVATYSRNYQKIRIEFSDGTHMVGLINLHAKFKGNQDQDDPTVYSHTEDSTYRFGRTSDFLKDCNTKEGVITVFESIYGGKNLSVCFVFLHTVKFITEEKEIGCNPEEQPQPEEEGLPGNRAGLFLRERLKKDDQR